MGIISTNSAQIPSANQNASVMIGCYNAYYVSGETIYGNVFLNITQELKFSSIILEVGGIEQMNYKYKYRHGVGKNRKTGHKRRFRKYIFLNSTSTLYENNNSILAPGQYQFPFSFSLPQNLPPSFNHGYLEGQNFMQRGRIEYFVVAKILQSNQQAIIGADQKIYIIQNTAQFLKPLQITQSQQVNTSCCCWGKPGQVDMEVLVDKSFFYANEPLKIALKVNNEQGSVDIEKFEVNLSRVIVFGYSMMKYKKRVYSQIGLANFPGIQAGQKHQDFQAVELQMPPNCYYEQTTLGKGLKCNYTLTVKGLLKGQGIGATVPTIILPIVIAMSKNTQNQIIQGQEFGYYRKMAQSNQQFNQYIPQQWQPQMFNQTNVCFGPNQPIDEENEQEDNGQEMFAQEQYQPTQINNYSQMDKEPQIYAQIQIQNQAYY